ncbi:MAG TPA: heavy-metal-associated domain-containing protein [Usitatibacter sp.]|nr:heavy-metal-associated domain-containing protein [Usitatibacter sp.]
MRAAKRVLIALCCTLAVAANAKTVKMQVNGMVCAFCAQGIEKRLRAMPPTQDVFVSLKDKVVAVALKDGQDIPDDTLVTQMKEAGYDVTSVQRVDDSLADIRKAIKGK